MKDVYAFLIAIVISIAAAIVWICWEAFPALRHPIGWTRYWWRKHRRPTVRRQEAVEREMDRLRASYEAEAHRIVQARRRSA